MATEARTAEGTTRYLATDGDDNNDGSAAKPWKSVAGALKKAQPGMTILVKPGSYAGTDIRGVDGAEGKPIVMRGENKEKCIIDGRLPGASRDVLFISKCSWITFENLTIMDAKSGVVLAVDSKHIAVKNCVARGATQIVSATARFVQVPLVFEDVTARTNLPALMAAWKVETDARSKPGKGWWVSEVAAGDFTGSGRADLVISQHVAEGAGSRIFTNTGLVGDVPQFTDYTTARTLSGSFWTMGSEGSCHVVDVNGDGHPDVLVIGHAGSSIATNNGSGQFAVTTHKDLSMVQMHAGDATGDGRIDLIGVATRQPGTFRNYVNNGNGTYTTTSAAPVGEWIPFTAAMTVPAMAGLPYPRCRKANFGAVLGELVFVCFGEGAYGGTQNSFALREGGGVWTDVTASVGIPSKSVLAGIYDFNRDGLLDVLLTDCATGGIYRNTGGGGFVRQLDGLATDLALHARGSTTLDGVYDFDEDGNADILMVTARFGYESGVYQQVNGQYVRSLALSPCAQFVVTDMNGDGRLDLVALPGGGPPRIYMNRTPAAGNWLNVRLTGPAVNKVAIDALVEVYTAGHAGEEAYRLAYTRNNTVGSPATLAITGIGHSHGGNLPVHVGVGPAVTVDVRVTYPGGATVTALGVTTNQTIAM